MLFRGRPRASSTLDATTDTLTALQPARYGPRTFMPASRRKRRSVAVLGGAGAMGRATIFDLARSGYPVLLLDSDVAAAQRIGGERDARTRSKWSTLAPRARWRSESRARGPRQRGAHVSN